jgi:hypothetical protein
MANWLANITACQFAELEFLGPGRGINPRDLRLSPHKRHPTDGAAADSRLPTGRLECRHRPFVECRVNRVVRVEKMDEFTAAVLKRGIAGRREASPILMQYP